MRLVKNTELNNNELIEYKEYDILLNWKNRHKVLIQYCDLPTPAVRKDTVWYNRIFELDWNNPIILNSLVSFPRRVRDKVVRELLHQSGIRDDGSWRIKKKNNLVAYIFELAYNLGLMNGMPIKQARKTKNVINDEDSKKNKQSISKKVSKGERPRARKKEKPIASD